ncbi:MAG: DUF3021 domain-containing protein [Ruminococcaceae bacterium]|nr:DUF3021 domain-containing protein [Oscillospiraceae bacterium]
MKKTNKLNKIISDGCVINTVLLIVFYIIGVSLDPNFIPTLSRVFGILIYSLALSAANSFLFSSKMKLFSRLALHFIFTALVFFICFVFIGGYKANLGSVLVIVGLYLVIYAVVGGAVALIRSILKADENDKKEYKKVYEKKQDYNSLFGGKK